MGGFHVEYLRNKNFRLLTDPQAEQLLKKWSLDTGLHFSGWAFNEKYHPLKVKELISAILEHARQTQILPETGPEILIEPVPCTVTSMEFFDRLLDPANGVVSRSGDGAIRGCFEESVDNFLIADELRQMLLNETSEVYPLFSQIERKELLFRLFLHLALGGQFCQYEDCIQPYIDTAAIAYKTLLNVQKDPDTGDVRIRSKCYRVIVPGETIQDFIYIVIDPGLREAIVFAHKI